MKIAAILAICAALGALPSLALAATRDELETQALDHANTANNQVTAGVEAFKAGDSAKGCAAFRTSYTELGAALDLLAQDADAIRNDKTLSDDARATTLSDVNGARNDAAQTQDLVGKQIQQRCQTTT